MRQKNHGICCARRWFMRVGREKTVLFLLIADLGDLAILIIHAYYTAMWPVRPMRSTEQVRLLDRCSTRNARTWKMSSKNSLLVAQKSKIYDRFFHLIIHPTYLMNCFFRSFQSITSFCCTALDIWVTLSYIFFSSRAFEFESSRTPCSIELENSELRVGNACSMFDSKAISGPGKTIADHKTSHVFK